MVVLIFVLPKEIRNMKVRLSHAVFIAAVPVVLLMTQPVQGAQPNSPTKPPQATSARAVAESKGNAPTLFDAATAARRDTNPDLNGSVKEVLPAANVKR
jgi:hypothetical protein